MASEAEEETQAALLAPAPESLDGSWTASDSGFTIDLQIHGSLVEGSVVYSLDWAPPRTFSGKIEPDGRVDLWITGGGWKKRNIYGAMPHLKLSTGGSAGGADLNLRSVETN